MVNVLTPIELKNLKELCRKLGISEDYIDPQLDYYENKRALYEFVGKTPPELNSGLCSEKYDLEGPEQQKLELQKLKLEIEELKKEIKRREEKERVMKTEIDFSPLAAFLHKGLLGYIITKEVKNLREEEKRYKGPWLII
jgi:hypothetical protein